MVLHDKSIIYKKSSKACIEIQEYYNIVQAFMINKLINQLDSRWPG